MNNASCSLLIPISCALLFSLPGFSKETRDISVETVPVSDKELSPLDSPILWKNIYRQGPVIGVPMPWNLGDGEIISLKKLRVEGNLRASEVDAKIVMSIHNTSSKEMEIKVAVPISYENRDTPVSSLMAEMWEKGATLVMDGKREHLMERNKISSIRTTVDGKEVHYEVVHGDHPQKDAASMEIIRDVKDWIVFPVEIKGNQELYVEAQIILPCSQDIQMEHQKEKIGPARWQFLMGTASAWLDKLEWGVLALDPQEIRDSQVKITSPSGMKLGKKQGEWYDQTLTSEILGGKEPLTVEVSPEVTLTGQEKDLSVTVKGQGTGKGYSRYTVTASSTLEGTNPENIKQNKGQWAEGVSDDGKNEWVELSLEKEQNILGFVLVNGKTPVYLGAEEQKHPDLTHSFYGLPKKIMVTINGRYTFPVTLREDWNTQFIIPPYYNRPVKTIKVTLDTVRGGKLSADTWITQILPIVKTS